MNALKLFNSLCTPAQLYLGLSVLAVLSQCYQNIGNPNVFACGLMKAGTPINNVFYIIFEVLYVLGWYKGTNAVSNVPIRYKGGKALMEADPMHQPGLLNKMPVSKTANVPKFYTQASDKAVDPKFTIKIPEPTTTAA